VLSPSGTHPDGFPNAGWCAWHSATGGLPFTNMPYVLDAGRSCATGALGGRLDGFSIVSGHEYLEAVTDPIPGSGWFAPNGENADLCVEHNLHKITLPTGSFAVQPTYSNKTHGCAG
jgi:serine protease